MTDLGIPTPTPTFAKPCECDRPEPVYDGDGTCPFCGRQVAGKPMPSSRGRTSAWVRPQTRRHNPRRYVPYGG